jgi:superfamily II DNA or RNA helicase
MPAASYQAIVPRLTPDLLVGLTATPERADRKSLLPDFDGHIGAELRLWHALDDQLLVPFEYYGLSDGVDLRGVRWSRTGYDAGALGDLFTGHDARAALVHHQLVRRVANVRDIRALGFCVSVEHEVHGEAIHRGRHPVAGGLRRRPRRHPRRCPAAPPRSHGQRDVYLRSL